MQKTILKVLLGTLLSLLISSCATNPPDVPICIELKMNKGWCVNTISNKEFEVTDTKKWNGKTWWDIRKKMVQVPISSWAEIKKYVIKSCKTSKRCKNKKIKSWKRTVEKIDKKANKK